MLIGGSGFVRRKNKLRSLTPLELEIMKVLWTFGPANVQAVLRQLPVQPALAYTTVQTMLNVLHRKGKVRRKLKGKAFEYSPAVSREKASGQTIRDLLDRLFGGSAESLVMSLVNTKQLSPGELSRIRKLFAKPMRSKEGEDGND
jgi:BlaI family penicillinase repressor